MKEKRTSASLFGLFMSDFMDDDEEESSDEDFRVEDHTENSDLSNDDEDESDGDEDDDADDDSESNTSDEKNAAEPKKNKATGSNSANTASPTNKFTTEKLVEQTKCSSLLTSKLLNTPICCACLGDRSDDTNEIVECDGCKITVHEGCYGISDSISVSSTVSSCSTEPWFCEPCKANIKNPDCELCPNKGGIFKETDCGKWVHLVCALYVPGVAFGEVDQLSSVTLFEMQYNKWGNKVCSLCEDDHFARTGVCIGCDAGMCKTYFHVTCAQREGLLTEAHHEEADQADPFYAHCKVHSDKAFIKHRKKNFNALLMQTKRNEAEAELGRNEKPTEEQERIDRKLKKHRIKYATNKLNRQEPWVPTQKMPRALITSASAVKKLMKKAEIMEIDTVALEFQEAQIASLTDIRKKWHIPPAFSTEFVGYYLDRSIRMKEMKTNLEQQVEVNKQLISQQSMLRTKYDDAIKINQDVQQRQKDLIAEIEMLHNSIVTINPNKQLPSIELIGKPQQQVPASVRINTSSPVPTLSSTPPPQMLTSRTMSVPTAAALKQGVGFPLNNLRKDDTGRILSTQCVSNDELLNECGICKKCNDQHLLAKCDTCRLYYHLGCLNPPLARHPKKSKLYAWQCSECDRSDDSAPENVIIPKGPRRSRIRYSKDGPIHPDAATTSAFLNDSFGSDQSLAVSRKSDESFQPKVTITNGSDINFTEGELEAHVKETLQTNNLSQATASVISTEEIKATTSSSSNNNIKKRERKPKTTNSQSKRSKPKPALSAVDTVIVISDPSSENLNEVKNENESHKEIKMDEEENHVQPKTDDETVQSEPINLSSSTLSSDEKKPKRGRPPKRTISQISNDLQKQQMTVDSEIKVEESLQPTLLDLSKKIECPLDQYRAFADIPNSIPVPYPIPNDSDLPKAADEPNESSTIPMQPTTIVMAQTSSELSINGSLTDQTKLVNGDGSLEYSTSGSSIHHKHKKRKSHKRHHSHSPSSNGERQSGKKHKRKHKHKDHDAPENPADLNRPNDEQQQQQSIEQPRIKIKFRAILQNAGDDKKPPKFLWHVPNEGNGETGTSNNLEHQTQLLSPPPLLPPSLIGNGHHHHNESPEKKRKKTETAGVKKGRLLLNISPKKSNSQATVSATSTPIVSQESPQSHNKSLPLPNQICDVCNTVGISQNLVKCDDCQKNYHFHCLIPPLKKTPKKRGYSWHCADCDPTDHENN